MVGMTIGIDLGDIWSHYCTLSEDGEVIDRGRFRTNPSGVDRRFRDLEPVRVAMEAGTHSIWVSEQIRELGHEVMVANVRELRAISHSDRKSDKVDAEKVARYARPRSGDPSSHRPPHRCSAGDADADPGPGCAGAFTNWCGELGARTGQALWLPLAGLIHTLLRKTLSCCTPTRSVTGTRSFAPADRGHDGED